MEDNQQFTLELDHFAQCILHNQESFTPGEEELQDMVIIESLYKSVATGIRVELKPYSKTDMFRVPVPMNI